jgi:GAF domain-containing protein
MNDQELFYQNGKRYVTASRDINRTVRDLVRAAAEAVGSDMGALFLVDPVRGVLKPAVAVNLPELYVRGCGEIPVGQQCCGRAVLHKLPWYVDDIWSSSLFSPEAQDAAKQVGVRAVFSVPVLTQDDNCLGSLSAHFSELHLPSDVEIERHSMFARLMAFALSPAAPAQAAYPLQSGPLPVAGTNLGRRKPAAG